jgi:hypothetical protein
MMPSRQTHARVYQLDFNVEEYEVLRYQAARLDLNVRDFILAALRAYLPNWGSSSSVEVELVEIGDDKRRVYLWIPYEVYDEIEDLVANRGFSLQTLVRRAIASYPGQQNRETQYA